MDTLKIKSTRYDIPIEWDRTKAFQKKRDVFTIDICDMVVIQKWKDKVQTLETFAKDVKDVSSLSIDKVYEAELASLEMFLEKKTVKYIVKRANNNIYALMQIVRKVSEIVDSAFKDFKDI